MWCTERGETLLQIPCLKIAVHASWACNANEITFAENLMEGKKRDKGSLKASVYTVPNVEKKKSLGIQKICHS